MPTSTRHLTFAAVCLSLGCGLAEVPAQPLGTFYSATLAADARLVVRDLPSWNALLAQVSLTAPFPEVDFSTHAVAVVGLGAHQFDGHRVEFAVAHADGATLHLGFLESAPGPDCIWVERPDGTEAAAIAVPRFDGALQADFAPAEAFACR